MHFSGSKLSNSYHYIHNAGKGDDEECVKEGEEVSLVGEGGEEEADEGDAGEVGDDQGEQAEKQLHCSSHPPSYLIQFFYLVLGAVVIKQGTELVFELWPDHPDFLILFHLSHVFSLTLFDE